VQLAKSLGVVYNDFKNRYSEMAKTLGFEGHIKWAAAMP
jgi:hypothetical protein